MTYTLKEIEKMLDEISEWPWNQNKWFVESPKDGIVANCLMTHLDRDVADKNQFFIQHSPEIISSLLEKLKEKQEVHLGSIVIDDGEVRPMSKDEEREFDKKRAEVYLGKLDFLEKQKESLERKLKVAKKVLKGYSEMEQERLKRVEEMLALADTATEVAYWSQMKECPATKALDEMEKEEIK